MQAKNEKGNSYGRLKVLGHQEDERAGAYWKCKCECGEITVVSGASLRKGDTRSCGCLKNDLTSQRNSQRLGKDHPMYKHGDTGTRFYKIYKAIEKRCSNPDNQVYDRYGGRGIDCEWSDYLEFKDDMYDSYKNHVEEHGEKQTTIDRIDNDGNYSKENCRWATYKQQARNSSNNRMIEYNGKKQCAAAWAEDEETPDIDYGLILSRIDYGWSIERALTEPVNN